MTGTCRRCGATGRVERHHPTGRIAGIAIHAVLVALICVACHLAEGDVWREAGLDSTSPNVAVLLRRLAVWLARWIGDLPADLRVALADVLADLADRLDGGGSS